jgi:hypothetical protein
MNLGVNPSPELSGRGRELRLLGDQVRLGARRLGGLVDLRWQSRAAEAFRARVRHEAREQLSLADALDEAAAAFDRLAALVHGG